MPNKLKFRVSLFLIFIFSFSLLPASRASVARRNEADLFLQQMPSSRLPSLEALLEGKQADVPHIYGARRSEDFTYNFAPQFEEAEEGEGLALHSPHGGHGHHGHGLRRFVIFARCVVRSFYIVRFEANDLPDNPIGLGMPETDTLCPEQPQVYLQRASTFADHFFHL